MKKLALILSIVALLFTGCSQRLGNMSVVSTNNIHGLTPNVNVNSAVEGKSCYQTFFVVPVGDFYNRLQVATDNAINNGRAAGLQGDTLINAKVDESFWFIPFIYGHNCTIVSGNLVKLSDNVK